MLETFKSLTGRAKLAIILTVVFVTVAIVRMTGATVGRNECEKICVAKGFADARYTPKNRSEAPTCRCLTVEEKTVTNRVPKGVEVPLPSR